MQRCNLRTRNARGKNLRAITDRRLQNGANGLVENSLQIILAQSRALHVLQRCAKTKQ